MNFKATIYIILLLALPLRILAQTSDFTQTYSVPLQLNPALLATDNNVSLMLNYRNQQFLEDISGQSTIVSGKYPLIKKGTNQRWGGFGISFLHDKSNDEQLFQRTQLEAAFAYNFTLAPQTYLSWGVQAGYHQQRFSSEGITTGSQYDPNYGFNPEIGIGEDILGFRSNYLNLSSGLHLYRTDARQEAMTYLGIAIHRIQQPHESFLNDLNQRYRQFVIQAGQRVFDNRIWTITPTLLWMTEGPQSLLRVGSQFRYHFKNTNPLDPLQSGSVDFGTYYTDANSIALSIQFNQPNFSAGFSYDIGTNGQVMQNATELTLALRKRINRRKPTKTVRNYSVGEVRNFYESQSDAESISAKDKVDEGSIEDTAQATINHKPGDNAQDGESVEFSLKKTFGFAFNDASLTPDAQAYFDDFVALMQMNPRLQLKVVGHTDDVGKERVNLKVSLERAQAVKDYLVAQGISKHRIIVEGVGSSQPISPNDTPTHRANNRRVELIVFQ